jgi:hypothetical protein
LFLFPQEKEIAELNEMLTDAGETFQQKEEEISKLKQVIADFETQAKEQVRILLQQIHDKAKKKNKLLVSDNMAKKIGSVGRNEILFYFGIFFFDTAGPDTTAHPLAVTMLVLSTGRCMSWKIFVTVMVLGLENLFPVLAFVFFGKHKKNL